MNVIVWLQFELAYWDAACSCDVIVIIVVNGHGRHEFKSWTSLIPFNEALISLGKVWIQIFSLQLWVNSRADWLLQPWFSNQSRWTKILNLNLLNSVKNWPCVISFPCRRVGKYILGSCSPALSSSFHGDFRLTNKTIVILRVELNIIQNETTQK